MEIYSVCIRLPYDGMREEMIFASKGEALEYFKNLVLNYSWKCEVYMYGPKRLPCDPFSGQELMSKSIDPDERDKLLNQIEELQGKVKKIDEEREFFLSLKA